MAVQVLEGAKDLSANRASVNPSGGEVPGVGDINPFN